MSCEHCSHCAPSAYDVLKTIQMELNDRTAFKVQVIRDTPTAHVGTFNYAGHSYEITVRRVVL